MSWPLLTVSIMVSNLTLCPPFLSSTIFNCIFLLCQKIKCLYILQPLDLTLILILTLHLKVRNARCLSFVELPCHLLVGWNLSSSSFLRKGLCVQGFMSSAHLRLLLRPWFFSRLFECTFLGLCFFPWVSWKCFSAAALLSCVLFLKILRLV